MESHPNLISGFDEKVGRPIVLKLLHTHEAALTKAANAELNAVVTLQLDNPIVALVPLQVKLLVGRCWHDP